MIINRLSKKPFSKAEEFHCKGRLRTLRIWDEAVTAAEPIHIALDDIVNLYAPLRYAYSDWVAGLRSFADDVNSAVSGAVVTIPREFGTGVQFRYSDKLPIYLDEQQKATVQRLKRAEGRRVRVCHGKGGAVLVGAGAPLPKDLAPLIVLDASARVKEDYRLWGRHRGNVEILPEAVRDYRDLTVRIWKRGCGNTALADDANRGKILRGIAEVVNSKADERWRVIAPKDRHRAKITEELPDYLDNAANVSFLHWGIHHGTNEFADVKNMVVVGGFLAPDTAFLADYIVATGVDPSAPNDDDWRRMKTSKLKDNLLQAFCRGDASVTTPRGLWMCPSATSISSSR